MTHFIWTSRTRREGRDSKGRLRKPHGETVILQSKEDPDGYHVTDERGAEKRLARNRRNYKDPISAPRSTEQIMRETFDGHDG